MWYYLDYNPEPNIFKVTDQTKALQGNAEDVKGELSNLFYDESLGSDKTIIDYVEIKTNSIFSDILWDYLFQGDLKIISTKTFDIINEYSVYNLKSYKTIVKKGKTYKDYVAIRGYGELFDFIDFSLSKFEWYKIDKKESEIIQFENHLSYVYKSKQVGKIGDNIHPFEIYFKDNFKHFNYDLLPLGKLKPCSFVISEKIKNRLESENLIGFEFLPCVFIKS